MFNIESFLAVTKPLNISLAGEVAKEREEIKMERNKRTQRANGLHIILPSN